MARKDLLKGLMGDPPAPPKTDAQPDTQPDARPAPAPDDTGAMDPARPRMTKGAIGAVSRSIADLKSRSVIEIDPHMIHAGGVQDRLTSDPAEDAELARSIAEYGQQVPVLVRPHPDREGRYQIVYGRRRVLAMRDLGQPVKALVRDLDDRELVLAQGQENTARRDLSFIEKANFARQMVAAGYERKHICDAISVDKTMLSRMMAVVERIPVEVIEGIGAASGVGRDRWLTLADLIEANPGADEEEMLMMIGATAANDTSDARFQALHDYLAGLGKRRPAEDLYADESSEPGRPLHGNKGQPLGRVEYSPRTVTLKLTRRGLRGFDDWLVENMAEIHRDFLKEGGE